MIPSKNVSANEFSIGILRQFRSSARFIIRAIAEAGKSSPFEWAYR